MGKRRKNRKKFQIQDSELFEIQSILERMAKEKKYRSERLQRTKLPLSIHMRGFHQFLFRANDFYSPFKMVAPHHYNFDELLSSVGVCVSLPIFLTQ